MNIDRKEKIQEWQAKGAEWCAVQLWATREQLAKEKEAKRQLHGKLMERIFESESQYLLAHENLCMATVLQENGIRPVKLRLTYLYRDCEQCSASYGNEPTCEFYECDSEEKVIESVSLYTYSIDGKGNLKGITSQFKVENYNLLKAVDERTGEVIYAVDPDKETS